MYYIDYHIHSEFSSDCNENIDNICEQAIERGIDEIAITDHLDILKGLPYNHSLDLDNLFVTIKEYKKKYEGRLKILQGVELGQPYLDDKEFNKAFEKYKFDFVIGSVHTDENLREFSKYKFSDIDCYEFYKEYLQKVKILAGTYDYDVLGHLTFPLRYMARDYKIKFDVTKFEQEFIDIFDIVIRRNKGIEVNTSGIATIGEPMPSYYILKLYKDCGGEILTTGSDSHKYFNVGYKLEEVVQRLKTIGFDKIATYEDRKLTFRSI